MTAIWCYIIARAYTVNYSLQSCSSVWFKQLDKTGVEKLNMHIVKYEIGGHLIMGSIISEHNVIYVHFFTQMVRLNTFPV